MSFDFQSEALKFAAAMGSIQPPTKPEIPKPHAPGGQANPRTDSRDGIRALVSTNKFAQPFVKAADIRGEAEAQAAAHKAALRDYVAASDRPNRKVFFGLRTSKKSELERLRESVAKLPASRYRDAFANIDDLNNSTGAVDKYRVLQGKFDGIKQSPIFGSIRAVATPFGKEESVVETIGRYADKALQRSDAKTLAAAQPSSLRRLVVPMAVGGAASLALKSALDARREREQQMRFING